MAGSSQAGGTRRDWIITKPNERKTERQTFYIIVIPFPSVQFDNIPTCEHPVIINDAGDKVLNSLPKGSSCCLCLRPEFTGARGILGFDCVIVCI